MSRRPLAAILASLLLGGLIAVTTSVRAEERPAPTRGAVLALLTEHVETEQGKLRTRFWWKSAAGPAWTETDRALQRHLRRRGLRTSAPDDETRISRIYRHPNLSVDNATALASVLRERRVLVGEV
ncbi:MAG: hypothetical protein ABEL76_15115, partial [Bradymonadaceae bacterium]